MNINLFIARTLWSKNGKHDKSISSSTIIAQITVIVSFVVIITAIVISDGFRYEIKSKASGFCGDIILNSPGVEYNTNLYPVSNKLSYFKEILALPDVKSLQGYAYRSGMIKFGDQIQGVVIKGVGGNYDWSFLNSIMSEGSVPDYTDSTASNEILLSRRLADMMGFKVGDDIQIYFIDKVIRVAQYRLKGVFDAQLEDIDRTLVIADIREVQRLNGWNEDQVSGLEIMLSNGADRDSLAKKIDDIVSVRSTDNDTPVSVSRIDDLFPHLFDWLRLLDFNVMIVLLLMMVVAGFNMLSGLLILLFEKISVIGLLKALGMRNPDIHSIFMYKGLKIVVRGMVIGNVIAISLALVQKYFQIIKLDPENYFMKAVPVHFDFWKIAGVDVMSVVVIMLLMLLPSVFVAKVSPDKSIRVK